MSSEDSLKQGLVALGIEIEAAAPKRMLSFLDLVLETNKTMNLTAITDREEGIVKHLVDSLAPLGCETLKRALVKDPAPRWTDLGSGAGFPGIPLALAVPQAQLNLVESVGKKAHFLEMSAAQLGLSQRVKVFKQRAEVLGHAPSQRRKQDRQEPTLRASQDAVFCRGLARIASLLELAAPLLKVGGHLIAYKGPRAEAELLEARKAMDVLGMTLVESWAFQLPTLGDPRIVVVFEKKSPTRDSYPRETGLPQREPIL